MTYAEFKRTDVYEIANVVELFNEQGFEIDDNIPEEILDSMAVNAYFFKSGWLTVELGEAIDEFE